MMRSPDIAFRKMHGLGNDFVVLDARQGLVVTPELVRAVSDRRRGVGCDQILVLDPPQDPRADVFLRIFNADGSVSGACGNGTRCVAGVIQAETGRRAVIIETMAGLLHATGAQDGLITVDMGKARHDWAGIPLRYAANTDHLPLTIGPLRNPVATSIGNPHATFFVDAAAELDTIALAQWGPLAETHEIFPERANIGVACLAGTDHIRLRMWERGAGITPACGTGACAAVVAAVRRGLISRTSVRVTLDGGDLWIDWREDDHVLMRGPIATSFTGVFMGEWERA